MGGMPRSLKIVAIGLGLAGSLTACSGLKNALGMEKTPPDEFAVVTKAPLVIPPDFALKPPKPGAADTQQLTPGQTAEQTVFGKVETQETASADQSQGELALLEDAGAQTADPGIRNLVSADGKAAQTKDPSLTDRLMFWKGSSAPDEGISSTEQDRIRQNEAAGKSPAEGAEKPEEKSASASSGSKGGFLSHLWPF